MRTHPHAEATSRVVARAGGTFGVEVVIPPPRLQPKRGSRGTNGASDRRAVGEMVPQDPIEYGEQPSRGSRADQDRLDQPVRRRRTRDQLRIQVGIRFRRRRLSRSLCPPLRVASVRSPTRLQSRNCRKDSQYPQFRAAAVRQIEAFVPHW